MALQQDQAQASEAAAIIAEKKYRKDLAAYNKQKAEDEKKYQKELAEYNKQKAEYDKQKAEYDAQQKRIADAKAAEAAKIAEEERLAKEKADKRAAQFAEIERTYQETLSKNPYTEAERKKGFAIANQFGKGNKRIFNRDFDAQKARYNAQAQQAKIEAEKKLREQHFTADGYDVSFVAPTNYQDKKSLYKFIEEKKDLDPRKTYVNYKDAGMNTGMGKVGIARHWLLEGKLTMSEYQKIKTQGTQEWQADHDAYVARKVASSKAKVAGQVAADRAHWANVASGNYDAKNPGHNFVDVKATPTEHGYATANILKAVEINKSGTPLTTAAEISNYITINKQTYKVPEAPTAPTIPVRTNTSSVKGVNEANITQKQYVQDLRDGKIGLAQALLEPQTPQMVSKNNTINLKQFLAERGYTDPATVPDSVLTTPQKYDLARNVASYAERTDTPMGDLRKYIPRQPQVPQEVAQQRRETLERSLSKNKGGSFIGYGDDGTPMQGAPFMKQEFQVTLSDGTVRTFETEKEAEKFAASKSITKFDVTYAESTSIPTMYGVVAVQQPVTKTFDSEQEAQAFIDKRQANLPYTQDAKILPMEAGYRGYDQFAKEAYKRAEDHPDSWIYQGGAAWTSFGGDMLNLVTMGGDVLDKYVFKRPVVEKQPITTIPTYYDKGFEKAVEGIEITDTGVTGVSPSLVNPLDEGNVVSKWYQGAAKQWEKQTPAENIGQSTVFVPLAIVDAISAAQAGTSLVRRTAPIVKNVATKITSTPTIVTRVVEASAVSTKLTDVSVYQKYAKYNINTIANPDRIDLNLKGADYYDQGYHLNSPKPKPLNLQSPSFQENVIKSIGKSDATTMYGTTKEPFANPFVKFWDKVTPKEPPKPSQYAAATQSDVILSRNTFKKTSINLGEEVSQIERNPINIAGRNFYGFTSKTVSLEKSKYIRNIKGERLPPPDYVRASSDFIDFQKSLTPRRYTQSFESTKVRLSDRYNPGTPVTPRLKGVGDYGAEQFRFFQERVSPSINIVGKIKFSEGFVPGKPTRQYKPFKPKEVEADSGYKPDGKVGDILSDTVSHSPLTVKITKPDKIARLPKTGKAPITKNPKYSDIDAPKLPKTGNAPLELIGGTLGDYVKLKPKSKPKTDTSFFTDKKSSTKKTDKKTDDTKKSDEGANTQSSGATTILEPPRQKPPVIGKQSPPSPPEPPKLETPKSEAPSKSNTEKDMKIIPPVIKVKEEKEKIVPRKTTSPRSITAAATKQTVIPRVKQNIRTNVIPKQSSKTSQPVKVSQTPRVIQATPQKITSVIKPKQVLRSPLEPKPKTLTKPKPIFKVKPVQAQSMPTPIPRRQRVVAAYVFPKKESKKTTKVEKEIKRKDFLGSSRTDHIEGMFKRTEIISGDKQSAKQLVRDKKFKEGKKKERRKKKKESFLQKMGVVNKGFKVI